MVGAAPIISGLGSPAGVGGATYSKSSGAAPGDGGRISAPTFCSPSSEAGSVGAVQQLDAAQIPERFRSVRGELRSAPGTDRSSKETEGEIA